MIHHLSIPARDPGNVADVLAELTGGICIPFPPHPGAYMAVVGDDHGSAIEVYPADTKLSPNGPKGADFVRNGATEALSAVHFALSVDLEHDRITQIADREGWESYACSRGGDFDVLELWIENRFLFELLPPSFAARYLEFAGRFSCSEAARALMASHERLVDA